MPWVTGRVGLVRNMFQMRPTFHALSTLGTNQEPVSFSARFRVPRWLSDIVNVDLTNHHSMPGHDMADIRFAVQVALLSSR